MLTKLRVTLAAVLVFGSAAMAGAASNGHKTMQHQRTAVIESAAQPNWFQGREIQAPPWAFVCMTDAGGAATCRGQTIWMYGRYPP